MQKCCILYLETKDIITISTTDVFCVNFTALIADEYIWISFVAREIKAAS